MSDANRFPPVDVKEASALCGLSVPMITYLGRIDVIRPTKEGGRGRRRSFTFNDVLFLRVIADLLSRGIEVKRLGAALKRAKADADSWEDVRKTPEHYLVTDGSEVFLRRKGHLESKTVDGQLVFAFVLDLAPASGSIVAGWPRAVEGAPIADGKPAAESQGPSPSPKPPEGSE